MKWMNSSTLLFITSITFTSQAQSGTLVDTRDSKVYKMVQIGTQTWMAENLAYVSSITYLFLKPNAVKTGIYCYKDDTTNIAKYGLLYSWDAAIRFCPVGWHLPTKQEFDTLLTFAGLDIKVAYEHLKIGGVTDFDLVLGGSLVCKGNYNNSLFFKNAGLGHYGNLNGRSYCWTATGKSGTNEFYVFYAGGRFQQCVIKSSPNFNIQKLMILFVYPFAVLKIEAYAMEKIFSKTA